MFKRHIFRALVCLAFVNPAFARPVVRYVFDRSGTQYDLGTAPAANATLTTNAKPVYSSPNTFSCAALDLTANGAYQNYATTGSDVAKLDGLSAMTLTLWVKLQSTPLDQDCLVGDMAPWNAPAGQGGWELRIAEPTSGSFKVDFQVERTYGGMAYTEGYPSGLISTPSQWAFIAVTYYYSPGDGGYSRSVYLGRESGAVAVLGSRVIFSYPLLDNTAEFRVGSASSEPTIDYTPPAWIDDVRVYDRVLSVSEIDQVRRENVMNIHLYESPTFFGIGSIPGTSCTSWAVAVSGDGSTVVGQAITNPIVRPFRWKDGIVQGAANQPPTWIRGTAMEVSTDGSVVVGWGAADVMISEYRPFRWEGNQFTVLDPLPGGDDSGWAYSVSGDGSVVVGTSSGLTSSSEGFRWENGATEPLPITAGGVLPMDISPDGRVIVGMIAMTATDFRAFRLEDGQMQDLGQIPSSTTAFDSRIRISANKQAIVGWGQPNGAKEAVMWRGGRTFGLGDLPGGAFESEAAAVSANGSRVVGMSKIGTTESAAFVWDRTHGMRNLKTVLGTDYGIDVEGWKLTWATGISDDGATIVGYGTNPANLVEGWVARLPAIPAATDLNGDGDVDLEDVTLFVSCSTGPHVPYAGNVPPGCSPGIDALGLLAADFDWDGDVDVHDFSILQRCMGGAGLREPECDE